MLRITRSSLGFTEYIIASQLRSCSVNFSKNFVSFTSTPKTMMDPNNMSGREIDLLETKDTRFRLPGNVGLFINDTWLLKLSQLNNVSKVQKNTILTNEELLKNFNDDKAVPNTNMFLSDERSILQCEAHECPLLLIKDFQELFPRNTANLANGLSVLTISQKSQNDMSVWSKEVSAEREELVDKFVFTAERMCNFLKENGYWADFIDPTSGRPFHGEYTPATFFETDERYRHFGFEIDDLGCCKVILHKKWGSNAFVGALFTNAPVDSEALQSLLIYMDD